jgi:hypothetical protein
MAAIELYVCCAIAAPEQRVVFYDMYTYTQGLALVTDNSGMGGVGVGGRLLLLHKQDSLYT